MDVSSSHACAQPPGNALSRQLGQELLVDREQVRPLDRQALRVGLEIRPPRHEIEVRPVRAVAVEQDDLLEPVVGERLRDVEHLVDEVLEMGVDRAREVHHVARVAIGDGRQDEQLVGRRAAGAEARPRSGRGCRRRAAGEARAARRRRTGTMQTFPPRPRPRSRARSTSRSETPRTPCSCGAPFSGL